ncbi:MAG: transmembrane 220 family protein [Myxococcaceae bacterium]|nr:transmembrane 220 family protein [Myxococcaceae bacterium]
MIFRVLNGLMAAYFAYATVVQLNDPDWLRWAGMYAVCAVICVQTVANKGMWRVPAIVAAIALGWALVWLPRVLAHPPGVGELTRYRMLNVAVEEAREFLGLLIAAVWMGLVALVRFVQLKRRRARRAQAAVGRVV